MDRESFDRLVTEVMAQGYSEETAAYFAQLIGDTPEVDEQGRVVVRGQAHTELARLALRFFGQG